MYVYVTYVGSLKYQRSGYFIIVKNNNPPNKIKKNYYARYSHDKQF